MNVKRIKMLIAFIGLSIASVFAEATATLYLIRPKSLIGGMVGKNVYIEVAGANIGQIPNKRYIKLEIPANLEITIGAHFGFAGTGDRTDMNIILGEGKTCYIEVRFWGEAVGTAYNMVMKKNMR